MMHRSMPRRTALGVALALWTAGCSTGPESLAVAGTWTGTANLSTTYSATLLLTRSGNTVAGTIQITGLLDEAFVGTLDEPARTITWTVFEGCEEWSGTFSVDSDARNMSGDVLNDQSGCSPPGSNASGTISLTKE